jgi:hypothetical protein
MRHEQFYCFDVSTDDLYDLLEPSSMSSTCLQHLLVQSQYLAKTMLQERIGSSDFGSLLEFL